MTLAWPFLVGRSHRAGHRVVVAPDFMSHDAVAVARLGWLATDDDTGPTEALYAEIDGLPTGPATAVYRIFVARESHYLSQREEPLTDTSGRSFRLTEGIVFRLTAQETLSLRLTAADLDTARRLLTPAYRDFWEHDELYVRRSIDPFLAGRHARNEQPLTLRHAADSESPPITPEIERPANPFLSPSSNPGPGQRPRRTPAQFRRKWPSVALAALASLVVFGVTLLIYRHPQPSSQPSAGTTVHALPSTAPTIHSARQLLAAFCNDLMSGQVKNAYSLTSMDYQEAFSEQAFSDTLLRGDTRAQKCSFAAASPAEATVFAWSTTTISQASDEPQRGVLTVADSSGIWKITALQSDPSSFNGPTSSSPTPGSPAPLRSPGGSTIRW